jgi:hypothetical protein
MPQERVVSRWLRLWALITRYGKNGWSQRERYEASDQLTSVEHLELTSRARGLTPDTAQWGAGKGPTRDSAPSRAVTDQVLIASCADLPQWPAACQHPHGVSSADLHNRASYHIRCGLVGLADRSFRFRSG